MKGSLLSAEVLEPYAEAIMSLAKSQDLVDRFSEDLRGLKGLWQESAELETFLTSPVASDEQKKAVLRQIGGEQLHPYIVNVLLLLIDRRRIAFLPGIIDQFLSLVRELKGIVLAEVISTVELSDGQRQAAIEKAKAISNAQDIELVTKIDRDLIGGVIIKVGSQVIDASLRGQLRRIGNRLNSAV